MTPRNLLLLLFAAGLLMIGGWRYAVAWHPSVARYPVQGVDVGEADGAIDWQAVAAVGADFGYTVATTGANRRDTTFETNWTAMPAAGLRRGAIHVYSLCELATDQANAFNTVVPVGEEDLPAAVAIDYRADCPSRPGRAVLLDELRRFAMLVETHTGKPILFRVSPAVERDYRISAAIQRPVWAIGNVFPPDYAARAWRMWRASDFREVAGIAEPLNWNVVRP